MSDASPLNTRNNEKKKGKNEWKKTKVMKAKKERTSQNRHGKQEMTNLEEARKGKGTTRKTSKPLELNKTELGS